MIAITMINSISVYPRKRGTEPDLARARQQIRLRPSFSVREPIASPLRIRSPILRPIRTLTINIENILPPPALRLRVVLHAAESPIARIRYRIDRHAPQKLNLLAIRILQQLDPVHQLIQRLRIPLR